MAFDLERALQAGATKGQILGYLADLHKYDARADLEAGANAEQLLRYLASLEKPEVPKEEGLASKIFRGITAPVVTLAARPFQLATRLRTGTTPDLTLPYYGKIAAPTTGADITSDIGRGLQTVGLGLGPVTGGVAFGAGSALETGGGTKEVIQQGLLGGALGKGGELVFRGAGALTKTAGKALQTVGKGETTLMQNAVRQWGEVLAPTTNKMKAKAAKIIPGLLKRDVKSVTQKGLQDTFMSEAKTAAGQLDEAWAALPAESKVQLKPAIDTITDKQNGLFVKGTDVLPEASRPLYRSLESLKQELVAISADGGETASAESVRSFRQILDAVTEKKSSEFGLSLADSATVRANKIMANTLREEISKQYPNIGKINAEFSFWQNAKEVLDATTKRQVGQQRAPLGEKIATGAAVAGGLAGGGTNTAVQSAILMRYLYRLTKSTLWQTYSASSKAKLANYLAEGNTNAAIKMLQNTARITGIALEKTGEVLSGTPKLLKEAPRKNIPYTPTAQEIKESLIDYAKHPKFGLMIEDVTKVDSSLLQEARKYKTAEEFVKAQGTPVYHGTNKDFSKFELTEGKRTGFMGLENTVKNQAISVSDNENVADFYGKNRAYVQGGNSRIIEAVLPKGNILDLTKPIPIQIKKKALEIIQKWEGGKVKTSIPIAKQNWLLSQQEFVNLLKDNGYIGAKINEGTILKSDKYTLKTKGGNISYAIFDPTQIKTKSQLTDIWNKAHQN